MPPVFKPLPREDPKEFQAIKPFPVPEINPLVKPADAPVAAPDKNPVDATPVAVPAKPAPKLPPAIATKIAIEDFGFLTGSLETLGEQKGL